MKVYINDHIGDFDLQLALQSISSQRREQALQFKFEQGQRLCVAAYMLLKQALREQEGILDNPIFEYGEHGKPSIVGSTLHYTSVLLMLCYGDSTTEEVVVPMVERDGRWMMK